MRFEPTEDEVGLRLDAVVAGRTGVARAVVQRALRSGALTVDGHAAKPSHRLEARNVVEGDVEAPSPDAPQGEDIPIEIRYSDDRVLVVSKPPGLVVHPAGGHATGTLVNALLGLGIPLGSIDPARPGIVHRLDKDTSGLLLVAKDDDAQAFLSGELKARRITREYVALVRGSMPAASGTVEAPIARHPTRRTMMAVAPGGRRAVTHYSVTAEGEGESLLQVTLETGRTHQIRVHLAHLGHPVIGDRTYGGMSERALGLGATRPCLHAWRLTWPDPSSGALVSVEDPIPSDVSSVIRAAGISTLD
ncbi:MAG TPA: RluA family pseudouridine synthase [Actinomycetota bacterium]|nr:RluA family pseudouridine synthase [Actinomycetota bacterium]